MVAPQRILAILEEAENWLTLGEPFLRLHLELFSRLSAIAAEISYREELLNRVQFRKVSGPYQRSLRNDKL